MSNLDNYVELVQYMGGDLEPVNAARVSMHKRSDYVEDPETGAFILKTADASLLTYLARNRHWTPFGHTAVTFRIKMPIYVARQWFKHQIGFVYNEVSRRYVDDTPEFESGVPWRKRPDKSVKQGSGETFADSEQGIIDTHYSRAMEYARSAYEWMIESKVAPEQARKVLPFSTYTEFWQTGNLESFARLCQLRLDPHAQAETREYAEQIAKHMEALWPVAWAARMRDYKQEEIDALKQRIAELEEQLLNVKGS